MRSTLRLGLVPILAILTASLIAAGCSGGDSGDGVKPENAKALSDANAISKRVDGDYDKLTADEKQVILKMANGSESGARQLCHLLAHPPGERAGMGAGPASGPPRGN